MVLLPLGAAGLLSGWMLLWGIAAAIPIVLHFWNQRRRDEIPWAAMQFLLSAIEKNSRRLMIEQWLLLLVRVSVLLMLALACAQPFLSSIPPSLGASSRIPKHLVIVLDTSYSMQAVDPDQARWSQAISRARNLLTELEAGDGVSLIAMGQPSRSLIAEATFDPSAALQELDRLENSSRGSDLFSTFQLVQEVIDINSKTHPDLEDRRVVVLTDLGRNSWNAIKDPALQELLDELSKKAKLRIEPIGTPNVSNLAVTSANVTPQLVRVEEPITITAQIVNFSPSEVKNATLQLIVDGQTIKSQQVSIAAQNRATVSFSHAFSTPRAHAIELQLESDRLTIDDRRYLAITPKEQLQIALIEDLPGQSQFVKLALQQRGAVASGARCTTIDAADMRDLQWPEIDFVVLCNLSRLPEGSEELLGNFVRRGGGLIGFLGDRIDPKNYAASIGTESSKLPLLPFTLSEPVDASDAPIDPMQYSSPILAPFKPFPESGLLTTPIFRYWKSEPTANCKVDMKIASNPLLIRCEYGAGQAAWIMTSPTPLPATIGPPTPWNAMAAWPSFLPLMREIVNELGSSRTEQASVQVGQPLTGWTYSQSGVKAIQVTTPSGDVTTAELETSSSDGFRRWNIPRTTREGIYRIESATTAANSVNSSSTIAPINPQSGISDTSVDGSILADPKSTFELIAVNLDTTESDLRSFDSSQLPSFFDREFLNQDPAAQTQSNPLAASAPLLSVFPWILSLLVVLLAFESSLAWWLGRHS